MKLIRFFVYLLMTGILPAIPAGSHGAEIPDLIDKVKPSIVGVGTVQVTRRPPNELLGTGFVVGNGRFVLTNAHVVAKILDDEQLERFAVFVGQGREGETREATVVHRDSVTDVAILQFGGQPLPALDFGDSSRIREGQAIIFTGFPIGAVLGLYPVTHRGIISAITPIATPAPSSDQLTARQIQALRNPLNVFQLDATAYPGNSGSPLIDVDSGRVIGIINQVFVKDTKESVLTDPSGITYAIPESQLRAALSAAGVSN